MFGEARCIFGADGMVGPSSLYGVPSPLLGESLLCLTCWYLIAPDRVDGIFLFCIPLTLLKIKPRLGLSISDLHSVLEGGPPSVIILCAFLPTASSDVVTVDDVTVPVEQSRAIAL